MMTRGLDSSVVIATLYRLAIPTLGLTQLPAQWAPGLSWV